MLSREGETFSSVSFFLKGRSQPRDRRAGLENLCLQHSLTHGPRAVWPKEGPVWNLAVLRAADVGWGHVPRVYKAQMPLKHATPVSTHLLHQELKADISIWTDT